jgi:hypothetical protein
MAACWSSPPRTLPEIEPSQVRRRDLTAAVRRSHLRSRRHHQSAPGEANRMAVSLVHLRRPHLTVGELSRAAEGMDVNIQRYICELGTRLQ